MIRRRIHSVGLVAASLFIVPGCRSMAVNAIGNAVADSGTNYSSDDDPELVGEAVPFALKTMEGLLESAPRHKKLLAATCSGFTLYSYAWVQQEADFVESTSLARATELRERARKLYLRALDYGFRGLEVGHPGFRDKLRADAASALRPMRKEDVGLLYWTAAAWAAAMALKINDSDLSADQSLAEAMARRALELDEGFEAGSIHDFFVSYESARASVGGSRAEARRHLERALELSNGRRAFPYVSFAESVCVGEQNRKEFQELLEKALAVDVSHPTPYRTANLVAQKRARWLLGRADELFVE
jgi:predicted anti-sigma-YlaC factor YlaD